MKFDHIQCLKLSGLALAAFTDSTGATGYIDGAFKLPANAIPLFWEADITTAFAGTTSATMTVGTTASASLFTATTTNSVSTTGKRTSMALAPSDTTERTVRVTVTDTKVTSPDFGAFSAGKLTLCLFYHVPE